MSDKQSIMSLVWQYFSKVPSTGKAKCGICEVQLVRTDGQTSSLKRHLKRFHSIDLEELEKTQRKKSKSEEDSSSHSQPKLSSFLASRQALDPSSPKAKRITYKIAKIIFLDLQPLSVVEDIGFSELIAETTDRRFSMPSRKKFSCNILPSLYMEAAGKVKAEIQLYRSQFDNSCLYGVTTDAWTSGANQSYVTYTLHMVKNYELVSFVLSTKELSESHTAENLRADLFNTLIEWTVLPGLCEEEHQHNIHTDISEEGKFINNYYK